MLTNHWLLSECATTDLGHTRRRLTPSGAALLGIGNNSFAIRNGSLALRYP